MFRLIASIALLWPAVTSFQLVREHKGATFFDEWDFYGSWDNLTLGDVWWLDEADAKSQGLAYINSANNAIIKVDNTSNVAFNQKRNTVRITSKDSYSLGSLWMIDVLHLPYGCSVWPAFWTKGSTWPEDGEIDIIEAINVMPVNQMALHTTPGCYHPNVTYQTGTSGELDCSTPAGCVVTESSQNSFESGFSQAGGGVWACQFDVAGVFIWFWSRPNVPASITSPNSSTFIDISQWGPPSASYPSSSCNFPQFFTAQNLVIDITLCGDWAGIGPVYNSTCGSSGPTGLCYEDNVVGPGSPKYDNAYFEISYVRAYTTPVPSPTTAIVDVNVTSASLSTPLSGTTFTEAGGLGGPTVVYSYTPPAKANSTTVVGAGANSEAVGGRVQHIWLCVSVTAGGILVWHWL